MAADSVAWSVDPDLSLHAKCLAEASIGIPLLGHRGRNRRRLCGGSIRSDARTSGTVSRCNTNELDGIECTRYSR